MHVPAVAVLREPGREGGRQATSTPWLCRSTLAGAGEKLLGSKGAPAIARLR